MSHSTGATHVTTPVASEGGGPKKVIRMVLITFSIFLLFSFFYGKWEERREKAKAEEARAAEAARAAYVLRVASAAQVAEAKMEEVLRKPKECYTPCKIDIRWPFKIRGEGNPLRITFRGPNGTKIVRDYPGEGDFDAPEEMEMGDTEFISLNEIRPEVRVQVHERKMVRVQ